MSYELLLSVLTHFLHSFDLSPIWIFWHWERIEFEIFTIFYTLAWSHLSINLVKSNKVWMIIKTFATLLTFTWSLIAKILWCWIAWEFQINAFLHYQHLYSFPSVWINLCWERVKVSLKALPQSLICMVSLLYESSGGKKVLRFELMLCHILYICRASLQYEYSGVQ